jgi:hypothetical protein
MPTAAIQNGWNEYAKFVIKELERLNENQESMTRAHNDHRMETQRGMSELKTDIAMLKLKSGIWGFAAGALPAAAIIAAKIAGLV